MVPYLKLTSLSIGLSSKEDVVFPLGGASSNYKDKSPVFHITVTTLRTQDPGQHPH